MIVEVGLIALVLGSLTTLYALGAALVIVYLLVVGDFSVKYVYDASSRAMNWFLRVTALWGGQAGSLLFWAWLMSGFIAVALLRKWERDQELMPWVIVVTTGTLLFFEVLVLFVSNPFVRLWHDPAANDVLERLLQPAGALLFTPQDGQGLNPLLRHFGMIGHPPTTYLGFTGFVIPYAFAIAALITRRSTDDEWIKTTRRWTLVAWIFVGLGLILGGRWAYDVLGWGGYWGWDPVENALQRARPAVRGVGGRDGHRAALGLAQAIGAAAGQSTLDSIYVCRRRRRGLAHRGHPAGAGAFGLLDCGLCRTDDAD